MTLPSLAELQLVVFDFDGVMTDNRVLVFEDGREAVSCSRADGYGCDLLRRAGVEMMILSTEHNPVVSVRAEKLKLPVIQAAKDKAAQLTAICQERHLDPDRILFVGNDLNDLTAMQLVGWPVAPADAHPSILGLARHITEARGGDGVVRELADTLIPQI